MTPPPSAPDLSAQLRLRPNPKPVLRLSRKALIIGGLVLASAVGGALMLALAPPAKSSAKVLSETVDAQSPRRTERLNQLPKTYADVPQLGPPLPGDLGKPMLNAGITPLPESQGAPSAPTAYASGGFQKPVPTTTSVDQAGQAARSSSVFNSATGSSARRDEPTGQMTSDLPDYSSQVASQSRRPQAGSNPQGEFLRAATDKTMVSPERLIPAASPYLLQAGSVLSAALITGIRSDLPGQVTAQVTQDIYDSLGNGYLLVPQGSRLIGQYDNAVAFGQNRVLLAWTRLILPNGKSIVLEKLVAADVAGQSGLSDRTDHHWSGMLNAAALSTLLSIGSQAGSSEKDDEIVRALREGAADSVNRTGQRIVERQLSIAPTLTIRPGFRVRVILTRDLVLEPYGG